MARKTEKQVFSFSGGEISLNIGKNPSLEVYGRSLAKCENFIPTIQGNVVNRMGLAHVMELVNVDKTKHVQLIPFTYAQNKQFMLVVYHNTDGELRYNALENGGWLLKSNITDGSYIEKFIVYNEKYDVYLYVKKLTQVNGITKNVRYPIDERWGLATPSSLGGSSGYIKSTGKVQKVKFPNINDSDWDYIGNVNISKSVSEVTNELKTKNDNIIMYGGVFDEYKDKNGSKAKRITYAQTDKDKMRYMVVADGNNKEDGPLTLEYTNSSNSFVRKLQTYGTNATKPTLNKVEELGADIIGKEEETVYYKVSSILKTTGEESELSNVKTIKTKKKIKLTFSFPGDADYCNVYKSFDGTSWGWIGKASGGSFTDNGVDPDMNVLPTIHQNDIAKKQVGAMLYHNQRIIYGNVDNKGKRLLASNIGADTNFNRHIPLIESDTWDFTIDSGTPQTIKHLASMDTLIAITDNAVWQVGGADINTPVVTPSSVSIKQLSQQGANDALPCKYKNHVLYAGFTGDSCHVIIDNQRGIKQVQDVTVLAEQIFKGKKITSLCNAERPNDIVWASLSDGTMASLTLDVDQNIMGWARHNTRGKVITMNSMRETATDDNEVYAIVERNGRVFVEHMVTKDTDYNIADPFTTAYMDSWVVENNMRGIDNVEIHTKQGKDKVWGEWGNGISADEEFFIRTKIEIYPVGITNKVFNLYDKDMDKITFHIKSSVRDVFNRYNYRGTVKHAVKKDFKPVYYAKPITEIDTMTKGLLSPFEHKDTVRVVADGNHLGDYKIADIYNKIDNGVLKLGDHYGVVQIGLPYTSEIQTLPFRSREIFLGDRNIQVANVYVDFNKSRNLRVYSDSNQLIDVQFNTETESGGRAFNLANNLSLDNKIIIQQNKPYPANIVAISFGIQYETDIK